MSNSNNKQIAKNTIYLYIRMIVLICVQLYASRVVLNALGFEEYGLYSIVGAIVIFLGFINLSMASASQRFLAYSHGQNDYNQLKVVFTSVFVTHALIAVVILVLAEVGGVLYIQHLLKVPLASRSTAHFVFQMSLLAFIVKTLSVPYTASIIANERMNIFAFLSLLEGGLHLAAALGLQLLQSHRLIAYSIFMTSSVIITQMSYFIYCRYRLKECKVQGCGSKKVIRELLSYSGWNLLGAFSAVAIAQGVSMILNSFFGVVVNAARGIAFQVSGGVASLSGNFQQAINPQIVKSYAKQDLSRMHTLMTDGTRMCFFLLFVIAMPVIFNIGDILTLWLKEYPPLTPQFCQLILINALIAALSGSLMMGAMATGNIKRYQLIVASIDLSNLPCAYVALTLWPHPLVSVYVMITISVIGFCARLYLTSRLTDMSIRLFLTNVCKHIILPAGISLIGCCAVQHVQNHNGAHHLLIGVPIMFVLVAACLYLFGLSANEKQKVISTVLKRIRP